MSDRRRIEERIRKKEHEIQALESNIREAKAYVQALLDVLKMFPKEVGQEFRESQTAPSSLRAGSNVFQARAAILAAGQPLHVSNILQKIGKHSDKQARISLSSQLASYVRKGEVFTRPSPNTFGLTELGHSARSAEPPPDFGSEENSA